MRSYLFLCRPSRMGASRRAPTHTASGPGIAAHMASGPGIAAHTASGPGIAAHMVS
ncbi:MAG: hypothetical protein IT323_17920, partial [Anaerolineae bacterium]|nr:hypothetical protein [Anaerolineae bacterium]